MDESAPPIFGERHPEISPDDFLAWCDPREFGGENFWHVYPETQFKRVLEHAFGVWAKEQPERKPEYIAALAEHGMYLVPHK